MMTTDADIIALYEKIEAEERAAGRRGLSGDVVPIVAARTGIDRKTIHNIILDHKAMLGGG